jgi:hypothetical protein
MLRHACGYGLADRGKHKRLIQDFLGHKSITSTVRYTESNAARFRGIWRPCGKVALAFLLPAVFHQNLTPTTPPETLNLCRIRCTCARRNFRALLT